MPRTKKIDIISNEEDKVKKSKKEISNLETNKIIKEEKIDISLQEKNKPKKSTKKNKVNEEVKELKEEVKEEVTELKKEVKEVVHELKEVKEEIQQLKEEEVKKVIKEIITEEMVDERQINQKSYFKNDRYNKKEFTNKYDINNKYSINEKNNSNKNYINEQKYKSIDKISCNELTDDDLVCILFTRFKNDRNSLYLNMLNIHKDLINKKDNSYKPSFKYNNYKL